MFLLVLISIDLLKILFVGAKAEGDASASQFLENQETPNYQQYLKDEYSVLTESNSSANSLTFNESMTNLEIKPVSGLLNNTTVLESGYKSSSTSTNNYFDVNGNLTHVFDRGFGNGSAQVNQSTGNVFKFNVTFDEKARKDGFRITTAEETPFSVLLIFQGSDVSGLCTGTLLTVSWVLTAAHCMTNMKHVQVCAGGDSKYECDTAYKSDSDRVQLRDGGKIYPHPSYDGDASYDVGLVDTLEGFVQTKYVQTIRLSTEPWKHVSYVDCTVTGFGNVYLNKKDPMDGLRKTHMLSVKKPCLCNFRLKMHYGKKAAKRMICSKVVQDYGTCVGDSGSGLVCGETLVATDMLLENIYDMKYCEQELLSKMECGMDRGLNVFLDVCPNLKWINDRVILFDDDEISAECYDRSASNLKPWQVLVLIVLEFIFYCFVRNL